MLESIDKDYKHQLMTVLLAQAYEYSKKDITKQTNRMFFESLKRTGTPATGRIDMTTPIGTIKKTIGRGTKYVKYVDLDPGLEDTDLIISKRRLELDNEIHNSKGYLRRLFNLVETYGDFELLLPDFLFDLIPVKLKTPIYDSAVVLPKHAVMLFNNNEHINIDNLRERLLINLLLKGR